MKRLSLHILKEMLRPSESSQIKLFLCRDLDFTDLDLSVVHPDCKGLGIEGCCWSFFIWIS